MPDIPEVVIQSKKRFKLCEDAEHKMRIECLDDLRFRKGGIDGQWDARSAQRRKQKNQPCLTLNVLPTRERQILNDRRRNRNAIDVHPVDDQADIETARVLKGIIRHIEYDSNADVAYDRSDAAAVRMGFGFIDVDTVYEDTDTFNQVIKIGSVRNPFQRYIDPSSQEPDGSDAEFGYKFFWYTKEEYEQNFPGSELAEANDWNNVGDKDPKWLSSEGCRVVHYYYKDKTTDKLLLLQAKEGEAKKSVKKSDYPNSKIVTITVEGENESLKQKVLELPSGVQIPIVQSRDIQTEVVKCCKHNAIEILEETIWPGKWIPIIPVLGDELDVDGERILEGMVRHAKDAIRMENVMASAQVQAIQLAPSAPWQAAEGTIAGYEKLYETANSEMHAVLPYKLKTIGNQLAPKPERVVQEPAIRAITDARLQFADDLKSITGINDAQLGRTSNEQSGLAINARKQQGELANFHFADNSRRAQRHVGRIIIDLIPKIYDTPRILRIIGDDGTPEMVTVNQQTDKQTPDGKPQIFDLTTGRYDVTVDSGPSYQTKREEAVEAMSQLVQAEPALLGIAGDLIVGNMDFPGAKEIAERIKKTLPPNLQDDKDQPQVPPEVQQKLEQSGQMIEQLTAHVNDLSEQVKTKQAELDSKERTAAADRDSKERIAVYNGQIQLEIKNTIEANQAAVATLTQEMSHVHELMENVVEHRKLDLQKQQADQSAQIQQQQMQQTAQQADADREAAQHSQEAEAQPA